MRSVSLAPIGSPIVSLNSRYRITLLALALLSCLAALWWAAILGVVTPLATNAARVVLPLFALAGIGALIERWWFLEAPWPETPLALADRERARRRGRYALLLLLTLAVLVRGIGVGHEVEERSYRDEGTYYHHASQINEGEVIRRSFVYPHLLYNGYALALWSTELFPQASARLAAGLWGVEDEIARHWLWLRLLVAVASAVTVWPVFSIAWRLLGAQSASTLGLAAGGVAGLLFVFSPLFNEGSHLIISDVPSGCLAAFSLLFVAALVERERLRDYALAGAFSGLAAAAKYPAGVVAVAIVAVWVLWRWRSWRSPGSGPVSIPTAGRSLAWLAVAGAASLAAFVAVMPSLLFHFRHALTGPRGMLFGARQYSGGGWIGVVRESNLWFYVERLAESFGWPALVMGLIGLGLVPREARRRVLWMLPFPVVYLTLISVMTMVVVRNLQPVLPILCSLLAVGVVSVALRIVDLRRIEVWQAAVLIAVVTVGALALPIVATLDQALLLSRSSTRELVEAWMVENLPPGARILHEEYTPKPPPELFDVRRIRFVARRSLEEIEAGFDVVVLAGSAWGRYFDPERATRPHHRTYRERYESMFERYPLLFEADGGQSRNGPTIEVRAVASGGESRRRNLSADRLFVPDGAMRDGEVVRFLRPGQWVAARGEWPAGHCEVTADPGSLAVVRLEAQNLAGEIVRADSEGSLDLPEGGRWVIRLFAEPPAELRSLDVDCVGPSTGM